MIIHIDYIAGFRHASSTLIRRLRCYAMMLISFIIHDAYYYRQDKAELIRHAAIDIS